MIPVITAAESGRLDAESGIDPGVLIERAGLAVALEAVRRGSSYGRHVAVLVGPGNNGADGSAAAAVLHRRGVDVRIHLLAQPGGAHAVAALAKAKAAGVPIVDFAPGRVTPDLVIDALFGVGGRPTLPAEVAAWREVAPVIAVDIPSGVAADTGEASDNTLAATATVAMQAMKQAHLLVPDLCGAVTVADIGLTDVRPVMEVVEEADAAVPTRPRDVHKWSAGSVLVVGGDKGMVGATVLAGLAALRFGAGSVAVASPAESMAIVTAAAPVLLTIDVDDLSEQHDRFDVAVVGPGGGSSMPRVIEVLTTRDGPMIFDAGAFDHIDTAWLASRRGPTIVTPHAGEFRRLFGTAPGPDSVREGAIDGSTVVVAKGAPTFISDGQRLYANTSNDRRLATIGTGDVQVGMIAALLSRGMDPLDAAISGTYWHGRTADLVEGTVTADRLLGAVGKVGG